MSGHAIFGLLALNAWLTAVGVAELFALRGWTSWSELGRLSGLAYMLGVATNGVVWVWELTFGLDMAIATILGTGAVIAGFALFVGYVAVGRRLPPRPQLRWPRVGLPTAACLVLAGIYFEALFRAGRLAGLQEFDGWAFWVPKAKAIFYYGGLDTQFFRDLPGPSYPPLVPGLQAAAFHFMGGADVVTVHLEFWFLLLGFTAAFVGVMAGRVAWFILWPPILLALATPHVVTYALQAEADFALDELIALAGLMVGLWLIDRNGWYLAAATAFLSAGMLTKREGYAFTLCIVLAAIGASWRTARTTWPLLFGAAFIAFCTTIPWRVFLAVRDLPQGGPEAGGFGLFSHFDRAWPSFRLTASVLFDYDIWLVVIPVALLATAAALAARAHCVAGYAACPTHLQSLLPPGSSGPSRACR
jgi:hypothetical protein